MSSLRYSNWVVKTRVEDDFIELEAETLVGNRPTVLALLTCINTPEGRHAATLLQQAAKAGFLPQFAVEEPPASTTTESAPAAARHSHPHLRMVSSRAASGE